MEPAPDEVEGTVEFGLKRGRVAMLGLVCTLVVVLSLAALGWAPLHDFGIFSIPNWVVFGPIASFFFLGGVLAVRRSLRSSAYLVVSDEGLSGSGVALPIDWTSIKRVRTGPGPYVTVELEDPEKFRMRLSPFDRWLSRLGRREKPFLLQISTGPIRASAAEVVEVIEARLPRLGSGSTVTRVEAPAPMTAAVRRKVRVLAGLMIAYGAVATAFALGITASIGREVVRGDVGMLVVGVPLLLAVAAIAAYCVRLGLRALSQPSEVGHKLILIASGASAVTLGILTDTLIEATPSEVTWSLVIAVFFLLERSLGRWLTRGLESEADEG